MIISVVRLLECSAKIVTNSLFSEAVVQNYTLEFDSIYIGNHNSSVLGTSQVFDYKHYI